MHSIESPKISNCASPALYYIPVALKITRNLFEVDYADNAVYTSCMDRKTELEFFKRFRKTKDKTEIVEAFMPMVYDTANKVSTRFPMLDHDQVLSDMQMCLLDSIKAFRVTRNIRFSTYLMRGLHRRAHYYFLKKIKGKETVPIVKEPACPVGEGREFAVKIVEAINLNHACLPPRQIRLLRSIYCGSPCLSMSDIAERDGVELDSVVKYVRGLLKKLQKGMT